MAEDKRAAMIERAAEGIYLCAPLHNTETFDIIPWTEISADDDVDAHEARRLARAALLVALDPEDEALVNDWARAHWNGSPEMREDYAPSTSSTRRFERVCSPVLWDDEDMREIDRETTRRGVRAAMAALKRKAQGETVG